MLTMNCVLCGEPLTIEELKVHCLYTGRPRCSRDECLKKAVEFAAKRYQAMRRFADEKERLLKPWEEKLEAELFLLEREYFGGGE